MTRLESVYDESVKFQLTSSRRGWRRKSKGYIDIRVISTHILTKRMTVQPKKEKRKESFQLTSSRRGWHLMRQPKSWVITFQLTSSRRGWHIAHLRYLFGVTISTHILTKRMTEEGLDVIVEEYISTHILTKRMTTTIEEGKKGRKISTHILTKRMTWPRRKMEVHWGISTHILTKRMTFTCPCTHNITFYFNSHPHEEDDGQWGNITGNYGNFNSHPHEEDDGILSFLWKTSAGISTHILTKRMTTRLVTLCLSFRFQLTSSRRGWR